MPRRSVFWREVEGCQAEGVPEPSSDARRLPVVVQEGIDRRAVGRRHTEVLDHPPQPHQIAQADLRKPPEPPREAG